MYQNIYHDRTTGNIHLWDDEAGYSKFKYTKYAYIADPKGNYIALDGKKVKRITRWNEDVEKEGLLYEADVPADNRVLIDRYFESDNVSKNHVVLNFDIEVDSTTNWPDIENPTNTITAIAMEYKVHGIEYCFILDPEKDIQTSITEKLCIISCPTEEDLLLGFLAVYKKFMPTIITGWNIDFFDIPYLVGRMSRVLGEDVMKSLSPINIVEKQRSSGIYVIAGITCLDYLALYKKFTPNEEPSYTLDAIGKKVAKMGKVEYEGTLDDLYKNDINKFIEYNLQDVRIVRAIDDKLDYIDIAMKLCHKGHVPYSAIWHSSRYLDGALLTYMRRIGIIGPTGPKRIWDTTSEDTHAEGAYVKPPIPGRYRWMTALDATSLYPSVIMTCNISGETIVGKLEEWVNVSMMAKYKGTHRDLDNLTFTFTNGKVRLFKLEEFKEWLRDNEYCVAGNGAVYKTKEKGFIPAILEKWFQERLDYKKLMVQYAQSGDKVREAYYDSLQYVTKILLNSMYGVLGLSSFRFYNLDNVEAVTITGQDSLRFADIMGNHYIKSNFDVNKEEDYCKYSDTDSCYFELDKIIDKDNPLEEIKNKSADISNFINKNLELFAEKHLFSKYNKLVFKEESVISSGFWIAKKRYAYHKIYDLEKHVPTDKIIVKGLDVVRSNFPALFRSYMNSMLHDILKFVDKDTIDKKLLVFKEDIPNHPVIGIAKPTGAKNMDKFQCQGLAFKTGTPAHIKAALAYNYLLGYYNVSDTYPRIKSGDKIKWIHLVPNEFQLTAIAFTGNDDPPVIMDFINKHINYKETFRSNLENKLQSFYDALGWGQLPEESSKLASTFFEF